MLTTYAIYLRTKNDTNGNPRRGWAIFSGSGDRYGFAGEGYRGNYALGMWAKEHGIEVPIVLATVEVTPSEFRAQSKSEF